MSETAHQKSTKKRSTTELIAEINDALGDEDFYYWNSRVDRLLDKAFEDRDALLGLNLLESRRKRDEL
jgi:hypothetical protein